MALSLISSSTATKALARASSQHSLSHEAERSHLELGSRPSTAVNSGNLNYRVLFPSNRLFVWLLQRSLFLSSAPSSSCPSLLVPSLCKALHSPFLSFPYFALIPRNRPYLQHQHFGFLSQLGEMADQQEQQGAQEPATNPLENVITNSECTLCKAHTFMIGRFIKRFNDLKDDYQVDSRSKRKKLEKYKAEIEALKDRCTHLEEAIAHIRTLTQSMQAEASTRASARKESLPDDSVNQKNT